MASALSIRVNERLWMVAAAPDTPLLYVLSGELLLQGPRFGCGLAQCGSCSPPPALHPVQQAFIDEQAVQCGYCYNGMSVKASELLSKNPKPTEAQIRTAMNGHLCRCGTYPRIIKAVQRASRIMSEVAK